MKNSILEIKNVSKYFGRKKVIDNINLSVNPGEIYGFLGPNGAGKTTTIKMILGLLYIDEGEILINGYNVKKDFEKAMTYIGGIVENPDTYEYMTALDNLKLHAKIRKVSKERITEVAKLVGLENRINDKVCKYSLGMKQRLGLAITLLHSPKVLILDEPTNGLDPAGIKALRDILRKIAVEDGVAVFVSSHLLSEMELMCDKISVLNQGKIVKTETIKDVLTESTDKKSEFIIETNQIKDAAQILIDNEFENKISDKELIVKIEKEKMPLVIKTLVEKDIKIYTVIPKTNSLEDVFFDITKGGKENE